MRVFKETSPVSSVSTGALCSAFTSGGFIYVFGKNNDGRLGAGTASDILVPLKLSLPVSFSQVSCGEWHTIALSSTGEIYSTGKNSHGSLGTGDKETRSTFTLAKGPSEKFGSVSAGLNYSMAISRDTGKLFTAGLGGMTARSPIAKEDSLVFSAATGIEEKVIVVSAGLSHCAVVTESGRCFTWGDNAFSQCGHSFSSVNSTIQDILGGYSSV